MLDIIHSARAMVEYYYGKRWYRDANGNKKIRMGGVAPHEVHITFRHKRKYGVAEMWIDGVQRLSYSNARILVLLVLTTYL